MQDWLTRRYIRLKYFKPAESLARALGPVFRGVQRVRNRQPRTFNEKIRYKRWRANGPFVRMHACKLASREYVRTRLGEDLLPTLYAVVDDPRKLDFDRLPRNFVLKPTRGSGAVLIVSDRVSRKGRVTYRRRNPRIHPDSLDPQGVIEWCYRWRDLPLRAGQWAYAGLPRRLMVEELLQHNDGSLPHDYKFYVFNGVCHCALIVQDRFTEPRKNLVRRDFTSMNVTFDYPQASEVPRPPLFEPMIEIAERLGAETDFVRVDLYAIENRIVFGEFACFPASGNRTYPPEVERELSELWKLDPTRW